MIYLILCALVALFLIDRYTSKRRRRRRVGDGKDVRDIPEAPGWFPFHQLLQLAMAPPWDVMEGWLQKHDAVRFRFVNQVYVIVGSVEMAKHMLGSKLSNYPKDLSSYRVFGPLLGTGLVTSHGERWRRQRTLVISPFKREMLHRVVGLAVGATERLVEQLEEYERDGERSVDLAECFRHLTLQVIGEAVLSMSPERCEEVFPALYLPIVEEVNKRAFNELRRFYPTPTNYRFHRCCTELNAFVTNLIKGRVAEHVSGARGGSDDGSEQQDILDRIIAAELEHARENGQSTLSAEDVRQLRDEVKTFLLAGHETSAVMNSWALYELARRPDVLAKVRAEADAVFPRGTDCLDALPTLDDLKRGLSYTEQVLRETLRLYSIVPIVSREAAEDDVVDGYRVPAGSKILIVIQRIHHREELWPDPLEFRPERFAPGVAESEQRPLFAFLPFTQGPRVCIGQHFALLESKIVVALLCQRFTFESVNEKVDRHPSDIPVAPLNGFHVRVRPSPTRKR